jgi:uncharacterized protein (TIGR02266 family)
VSAQTRAPLRRFRRRTVRLKVEVEAGNTRRTEWATTLGAGGMFLETDTVLHVGARLTLRFRLPSGGPPHELASRVAWVMNGESPQGSPAPSRGMGVEFTDPVGSAALARELEREPVGS